MYILYDILKCMYNSTEYWKYMQDNTNNNNGRKTGYT